MSLADANVATPDENPDIARVRAVLESRLLGKPAAATRIGRFVVIERIGAGAMGVVYSAFDPQLDRRVAIKLLFEGENDERKRARLLAEARALARLSHPNVVSVYEVDEHQGRVFVAMEHLKGRTLKRWVAERPREWAEILAMYVQAGRGLAAAHAAGIVHRDFKPDNVFVSEGGGEGERAHVLDFGLARAELDTSNTPTSWGSSDSADDDSATKLTNTGARLGTPAYMAPEQFASAAVDEAADQFAFCVALWEALYGERPFAGATVDALHDAITAGKPRDPPRTTAVPSSLRAIVLRGLAVAPRDRWPSMRHLLAELGRTPWRRRRRLLAGAGAVLVLAGAAVGGRAWQGDRDERCSGAAKLLGGIWDDARRTEVRSAMLAPAVPFGERAWSRVADVLDSYATEWTDMHVEACAATTLRGEQSTAVMDLRMACLRRATLELRAVTDVLADADADVVQNAHDVIEQLPPLSRCADVMALQADVAAPQPHEAEAVENAHALVAHAQAERNAGRYAHARARIESAATLLADVEYGPVHAELAVERGFVLDELGEYEAAAAALRRAVELATRWNLREPMRAAIDRLMFVVGYRQEHPAEALLLREIVLGLADTKSTTADAHNTLGNILLRSGDAAAAEAEYRAALELRLEALGPDSLRASQTRQNLAIALEMLGRYPEAEAEIRAGAAVEEDNFGPEHPSIGITCNNLGNVLHRQGKYAEAEAEYHRALAVWLPTIGPEHANVIALRNNLGSALQSQAKLDQAEEQLRTALEIQQRTGSDFRNLAASHNNLANVLDGQGKYAEAEAEHREALRLWQQAEQPDQANIASSHHNIANMLFSQTKYAEAELEHRRALAVWEAALGSDHPDVDHARTGLASDLLELGKLEEAVAVGERAWVLRQRDDAIPERQAETAIVLAKALWRASSRRADRQRAHALGERALAAYARAPAGYEQAAADAKAWLDAHPRP